MQPSAYRFATLKLTLTFSTNSWHITYSCPAQCSSQFRGFPCLLVSKFGNHRRQRDIRMGR